MISLTSDEDTELGKKLYEAMTGVVSPTPHSGGSFTWTSTGTMGPASPRQELVSLPQRLTSKVLIAFLDDENNPVWAKKLFAYDVNFSFDRDGEAQLSIELSLARVYKD